MYKAILTRFIGPTNHRGSRIIATDSDHNRAIIPYPCDLRHEDAYKRAAEVLCSKMGWTGVDLIGGGTKNGYAWVMVPKQTVQGEPK